MENLSIIILINVFFCFTQTRDIFDSFAESNELLGSSDVVVDGDLEVGEYCAAFNISYQYFCRGIWTPQKLKKNRRILDKIGEFCPSYKKACVDNVSEESRRAKERREKKRREEEIGDLTYDELLRKIQEITPCRQNCDIRIHPHCTQKCKCEHDLKKMVRKCSIPMIDEEKNSCKVWYMLCHQYVSDIAPGYHGYLAEQMKAFRGISQN